MASEPTVDLSVVAPCYNEQAGLSSFYDRVAGAAAAAFGDSFEIVMVDDGSSDATWSVIDGLAARHRQAVGLRLSRNYGHQIALSAGLSAARGRLVFVLDADLQDPPEYLAAMHALMVREQADVVFGKRRTRAGETAFKRQSAALFYRVLASLTNVDIPADAGDFRLMTRRVCDLIVAMPERDRFVRGMVAWLGFRQVPFEYDRDPRFAGSTNYSFRKMARLALDAFVGFSMVPLRLAAWISLCLFVILFGGALYTAFSYIFLDAVRGWTSITLLIILVSAVQLWTLSIIGEYVGRIYLQGKARPLYVVDAVRRNDATGDAIAHRETDAARV
jgi:glycosyltransferase involved in cell wall biosynthesis